VAKAPRWRHSEARRSGPVRSGADHQGAGPGSAGAGRLLFSAAGGSPPPPRASGLPLILAADPQRRGSRRGVNPGTVSSFSVNGWSSRFEGTGRYEEKLDLFHQPCFESDVSLADADVVSGFQFRLYLAFNLLGSNHVGCGHLERFRFVCPPVRQDWLWLVLFHGDDPGHYKSTKPVSDQVE